MCGIDAALGGGGLGFCVYNGRAISQSSRRMEISMGVQSNDFKFRSIRQSSVVDQIIDHFKTALINGELKAGQRLPSEGELCDQFGVGRSAIREAMKVLKALGVVTIQQGAGTYIVDEPSPVMLNPLVFAIMLEADVSGKLVELRRMIEIGYCELAAHHATDADWARIEAAEDALEDFASRDERDPEKLARLDLAFHNAILEASHNALVIRIGHAVEELYFASIRNTYRYVEGNPMRAIKYHRAIMAAIRAGDLVQIQAAVDDSLEFWKEQVARLSKDRHGEEE